MQVLYRPHSNLFEFRLSAPAEGNEKMVIIDSNGRAYFRRTNTGPLCSQKYYYESCCHSHDECDHVFDPSFFINFAYHPSATTCNRHFCRCRLAVSVLSDAINLRLSEFITIWCRLFWLFTLNFELHAFTVARFSASVEAIVEEVKPSNP